MVCKICGKPLMRVGTAFIHTSRGWTAHVGEPITEAFISAQDVSFLVKAGIAHIDIRWIVAINKWEVER